MINRNIGSDDDVLTLKKAGQKTTSERWLRTSTAASLTPGRRLTAFSTEAAQAEQVIPKTEKRAFTSIPSTHFSSSDEKLSPFGGNSGLDDMFPFSFLMHATDSSFAAISLSLSKSKLCVCYGVQSSLPSHGCSFIAFPNR